MADFSTLAQPLGPVEVRVLGSLIEKEITTPDAYPLTLNGLTLACNQTTSRDPVVSYDEATVVRGLDALRDQKLAYVYGGGNSRVPRYGHKLSEDSELGRPEIAVLCVLMLRGPQTVGEIKGRTGRMHEFADLEEVQAVVDALAQRPTGALVAKLPRQSGMKEQRYAQLLGGMPAEAPAAPGPPPEPATVAVRAENDRIAKLEAEVGELKRQFAEFKKQFE